MKLTQLSIFLENKPGHVCRACRMMADAGINIETMSLADTEQFGILRILVKDWQRAKEVYERNNVVVRVTEVVAAVVPHRPGGLADILDVIDGAGLNIEYMYGFSSEREGGAILVFRFDNPDAALQKMESAGVRLIGNAELFQ
ncbi:MAG TPA: amino acid-binding protein [Planctomycetaceae bacterium]|nr:amino acid-binding protein [Planctomycetaceae bacterium]